MVQFPDGANWSKIGKNWQKWAKIGQNRRPELARGQKRPAQAQLGQKRPAQIRPGPEKKWPDPALRSAPAPKVGKVKSLGN